MRSSREMRREAWRVLKGKWFWRLLCVAALLELIASAANGIISGAFAAMSITSVGDYVRAKIDAAQAGLSYSLPTAKAYCWMAGGFALQTFVAYIFAAILAFGFMGLLLKASRDDDTRWFADAFGGFARPLDVAWLLALMNLLIFLAMVPCGLVFAGAAFAFMLHAGPDPLSRTGLAVMSAASIPSVLCAVHAMYGYRQAWFLKNERPETSALGCLRASWQMMKGFKWRAFCLDFSFVGWLLLVSLLFVCSATCMVVSRHVNGLGLVLGAGSFAFGLFASWTLIKVALAMTVARVVFYRELKGESA